MLYTQLIRPFLLTCLAALLGACASTGDGGADSAAVPATSPEVEAADAVPEAPERPFPDESVYPLLVAEFALRRREYDVALGHYMTQSEILRDPGVSSHTTHLAQFMKRDEDILRAVELWLEQEPDNVEANSTRANLLVRQGRSEEAMANMAAVARQGEQANFPGLLTDFNELDEASRSRLVAGINELAMEFPNDPALLLTQAMLHAEFQQYDASLARIEELYKIEPYQPQALILEARILLMREAKNPFKRVDEALELYPRNKRLRLQYARLLTGVDMAAAREQFEILSAQNPRDADLLLSLALINREIGDDLEAKAYLQQMLDLGKRVDEAHYYLGRIAEQAREQDEAIAQYSLVGDSREFLSANQRVGLMLVSGGDVARSRQWFAGQRAAHPVRAEQLYALEADILSGGGYLDASMEVLNEALGTFPESTSLRYSRAMLAERLDDLALMESDLRNILAREPDNATALNALGYTLADRTSRYDEALDLIARALELQPEEPAILDSMGWVLYRLGRNDEAIRYLTRAYTLFPDPEVAAHLGEVLWVDGRKDNARQVWRGALLKAPDHDILLETLQRLGVAPAELVASAGDNT